MKVFAVIFVVLPLICAENIFKLDLSPEEAQKYLSGAPDDLTYAKKLDEYELPDGKGSYYHEKARANPEAYLEQLYLAHQHHGQDGLGKAKFGYKDWNQAHVADIDVHGKTQGAYQYVDPTGQNIVVKYWADSEGFHQTDNRPTPPPLEPVTDTPAVKAAREAHEKAWKEIAESHKAAGAKYEGSGSEDSYKYEKYANDEGEGVTGPPRGFFYSFDYKVPLIIRKDEIKP